MHTAGRVQLDLVLGQPRSELTATPLKGLRAPAGPLMGRVILTTVRRGPIANAYSQLAMCAFSSAVATSSSALRRSVIPSLNRIAAAAPLRTVLGDASAEVVCTLADGAEVRVVAHAAAVAHRERVLPGLEERLELPS